VQIVGIRRLLLGGLVLVVGATLACSSLARATVLRLWPGASYANCTPDPRIFCEPGAEPMARAIAPLMPAAIARVEGAQYGPFTAPVKVVVYGSEHAYARRSGGRSGLGRMSFGEVHLAPVLARRPAEYLPILTHELSHLHLYQHAGGLAMMRLPNWFMEGWPTLVSGGSGAGAATRENAIFTLVHGRRFEARDSGRLLGGFDTDPRMSAGMYYRQASLLVEYMQQRDRAAFARLVRDVAGGKRFAGAVQDNYGQPLAGLWDDFRAGLRADPAAQWRER